MTDYLPRSMKPYMQAISNTNDWYTKPVTDTLSTYGKDVQMAAVNLDTAGPTITVTGVVYGTYNDSVDITPTLSLDDTLSRVDNTKTTVTLDMYGIQPGTMIPLYTLPLGSHELIVTASDSAGNTSSQRVTFVRTTGIMSLLNNP